MKPPKLLSLALAAAALSACSLPQQIDVIEREQKTLRSQNLAGRGDVDSIRASLADTRANLDQLHRDVNAMKEKMEEVRYQLDRQIGRSTKEGDQRIKDLEARVGKANEDLRSQGSQLTNQMNAQLKARDDEIRKLREAMQAMGADMASARTEAASARAETASVRAEAASLRAVNEAREKVAADIENSKRDYDDSLRVVERKDYRAAIIKLKDFLKKYPNSELADNAQYWLGECHYALKEFDQAILEFDAVRLNYPKGEKVPAALLKQGFAYAELGDRVDARRVLQDLVSRYPQSEEAGKAKTKLKTLGS
jgi:tol-pal system protein YbgF